MIGVHKQFWRLAAILAIGLGACSPNKTTEQSAASEPVYIGNRAPLKSNAFTKLPVGSIQAQGWLKGQLDLQLHGFTRDIEKIWSDIGDNSGWKGGTGESWEAGPYYVRGAVSLAYNTGDSNMIKQVKPWIEWTLKSQRTDGFFGPTTNKDWWPRMLMLQSLETYYDATQDERVIPFMQNFYRYEKANIEKEPIVGWAKPRGGENLSNLYWLYNHTGDTTLLSLANVLVNQTTNWTEIFDQDRPLHRRSALDSTHWLDDSPQHTVNLAHGLKVPMLVYTLKGDEHNRKGSMEGVRLIEKYHEQIHGIHTGDERLGGRLPSRASELCEAVETMHSYEYLLKAIGDPLFGDKIEKAAFNALPSLIDPQWQTHAYYTQPNELAATPGDHGFQQYHGDNLTFSAASGFPCCTVNMHMGWPMFNEHLWLATPGNGLVAACYAPNTVTAKVGNGISVTIAEETGYPFKDNITFRVNPKENVVFPLMLRMPGWCKQPLLKVNGEEVANVVSGEFVTLQREWKPGDVVELSLPMEINISRWQNNSIGVERGPIAYALAVKEDWKKYDWKEKYPDWKKNRITGDYPYYEITTSSPWNYGLVLDEQNPGQSFTVVERGAIPQQPWDPAQAPVSLEVKARRIPAWKLNKMSHTDPIPVSPVVSNEQEETVKLLPYGATRLRVSYMPEIKKKK
jgi:hypothetical protein